MTIIIMKSNNNDYIYKFKVPICYFYSNIILIKVFNHFFSILVGHNNL